MQKVHMSLPVTDLDATEAFYSVLFDVRASKRKGDYLKFEPDEPALNISFVPTGQAPDTDRHLGIEFLSQADLDLAYSRLSEKELVDGDRENSICCYADQDKFHVRDPDGYEWELYHRLSDSEIKVQAGSGCCASKTESSQSSTCCN